MTLSQNHSSTGTVSNKPLLWLFLASVPVVWVFVWFHALQMDMTNDEAYSFFLIKTNYFRAMPGTANTHWLNSAFMKLFSSTFGNAPLSLRLHSVIAFPFFAWAVYRLALLLRAVPVQVAFYGLLVFNPYLLDFFALARGYGLALTFQAWSMVYLVQAISVPFHYRKWLAIAIFCALSVAANLSYLYTVLGTTGAFVLYSTRGIAFNIIFNNKQVRTILLLMTAIIAFAIADLLFVRLYGKDLEFGGDTNFLYSLFGSVWRGSLYLSSYSYLSAGIMYSSFALVLAACLGQVVQTIRQKQLSTGLLLCIPVLAILLLNLCFHLFLQTPYLTGRTALQWLIPGLLIVGHTISEWIPLQRYKPVTAIAAALLIIIPVAHLCHTGDSRLCYEWFFQARSKQPLYDLYAQPSDHLQISISLNGPYKNYYRLADEQFSKRVPAVLYEETGATGCDTTLRNTLLAADYTVIYLPHTLQCLNEWKIPYSIVKTYPNSSYTLVRILH